MFGHNFRKIQFKIFIPREINSNTIIITLEGIEKTKTEKRKKITNQSKQLRERLEVKWLLNFSNENVPSSEASKKYDE